MKNKFVSRFILTCAVLCIAILGKAQTACTIMCPGNIVVPNDANQCSTNVNFAATTTGNCGTVTYSHAPGSSFPVGTTTVTASTTAGQSCTFTVTVVDRQLPSLSEVTASPNKLWSPNHKMMDVRVNYTSSDNCPVGFTCQTSVTSNEPQNGLGDGDTDGDYEVVNNNLVRLRAERSGKGTGRIYTITVTCRDAAGNTISKLTNVIVPHDSSPKLQPNSKESKKKSGSVKKSTKKSG